FSLVPAALCAGLVLVSPPANAQPGDGATQPVSAEADDTPPPEGTDVQARGPVHEAFGEPTRSQASAGTLVSKRPPANIDEMPPEEKPEGDNIVWIPGYWGWDEERTDYLWVSGFWRAVPPGRSWVPGHWQQASTGYQWVSGYWGVAEREETEYLPPPPASI